MRRYYGSGPPGSPRPISLADLTQGLSGNGNSRPAAGPAQASPQSLTIQQQQPAITFVDAYGHQFPINRDIAWRIAGHHPYAPSNGESPATEAGQDDFEGHPSLATLVREESRRREEMLALKERENHKHHNGHHFGGYHPGKNARQNPSIRYVDTSSEVSRLFGVPVHELVSVGMSLARVEEQQNYEAWANALAGNGHYK